MAIGVFATRIIKDVEAAHPGTSIKVGERATQQIDHLASKLKLSPAGQFDEMDKAAIKAFTKDVVQSLAASEKGLTAQNLRSFQKAYSHSLLVEFPEGPGAEAAIREFRKSVNESLAELRQQTKPSAATNQVLVRRVDAAVEKDMADPKVIRRAAREQAQEEIAQANAAGQGRSGAPVGGDNQQIDSQTALRRATIEAERIKRIEDGISSWRGAQDAARNLFLSQMEALKSPDFAVRKQAYDSLTAQAVVDGKASDIIGVSGYAARSDEGAAKVLEYLKSDDRISKLKSIRSDLNDAELEAMRGKPRSPEEIEAIFKEKPGYKYQDVENTSLTPEQRQDALIHLDPKYKLTTGEWDAYKSHIKLGYLQLENEAILNKLDVLRESKTEKLSGADLEATFKRLREIQKDTDFKVASAQNNGTSVIRVTPDTSDTPKAVFVRLKEGKPVSDGDINRLEVYYNRHFREHPNEAKAESGTWKDKIAGWFTSSDQKPPSVADRWSEWNMGIRISRYSPGSIIGAAWKPATGAIVAGSVASGAWVWFNPGDYDEKSPTGFSQKEPNLFRKAGITVLTSPIGDLVVPDNGATQKDLYTSAVKTELNRNPSKAKRWVDLGNSDASTAPAVQAAIADVNQVRSANIDTQSAQRTAESKRVEQDLAAGTREFARDVTSVGRQGISVGEVNEAIAKQYENGTITTAQMEQLASKMVQISAQDGKEVMSRGEFETAMKDPVVTSLPPQVQRDLANDLKPKLP